jgi:hypothetical protein
MVIDASEHGHSGQIHPLHEGCCAWPHPAAVKARVQERTGRCGVPDIIWPVINAGAPIISAVKFDDPSARTAITLIRALPPVSVPKNKTES